MRHPATVPLSSALAQVALMRKGAAAASGTDANVHLPQGFGRRVV